MIINEVVELNNAPKLEEGENSYVLKHVKLCGAESLNNRRYSPTALKELATLYNGKHSFLDHSPSPRKYVDRIAQIKDAVVEGESVYGDVYLNPKHTCADAVSYDYYNNTSGVGMSHSVEGDVKDGVVEHVSKVHSIDLVVNPATTFSLQESVQETNDKNNILIETLSQRIDALENTNKELIKELAGLKNKPESTNILMNALSQTKTPTQHTYDREAWVKKLTRKK